MVLELLLHVLFIQMLALELLLDVPIHRREMARGGEQCGFEEGQKPHVPGPRVLVVDQGFGPAAPEGVGGLVGEDDLGGGIGGNETAREEDAGRVGDGLVVGEGAGVPISAGEGWVGSGGRVAGGEDAAPEDVVCAVGGVLEHVVGRAVAEAGEGFLEGWVAWRWSVGWCFEGIGKVCQAEQRQGYGKYSQTVPVRE